MPFELHHWDVDSETSLDVGWPRRYLTYDIHTPCGACHEPNGIRRICQYLFGGPATRCLHHRGRLDRRSAFYSNNGWGGGVRGFVRTKGCKNPEHYALSFQRCVDTSSFPERLGPRDEFRSRLPEACYDHTPRGHKPSHIWRLAGYDYDNHYDHEYKHDYNYGYGYPYLDAGHWGGDPGVGAAEAVVSLPYPVYEANWVGNSSRVYEPEGDANADATADAHAPAPEQGTTLRGGHGDRGRDDMGRKERGKERGKETRKGRGKGKGRRR
ncbi:hypothetical protein F5B17DRAFT_446170 [Nemania serpens]|nr:hypothetical protein F5B17DRAFT_446170 [Nemania serpens]